MIIKGLGYLVEPNKQFVLPNGSPNVAGIVRVYNAGTDDIAKTYSDFNGTRNPADIRLDNNGRAIIIADVTKAYRVEVRDSNGGLLWTVEPTYCIGGSGVSHDDVFKLIMTRGGGITAAVYDPLQSPDTEVNINETEEFDITQPGIYAQISESIANGRTPVVTAGSSGKVRLYYYTSKDTQNDTVTFTCGYDGIVELLVLHSDGTYEFTSFPGEVSVLKGNCDNNSVIPGDSGPTDFDCYEVEKEGSDIWIGSDKRVHAKAGWYHVDMGVYVSRVDSSEDEDEEDNDAVASIWFGAYTGTVPDNTFDYSDYCAIDFDLSYAHDVTHSVGFDIHVENDGDIIHLSVAAPADYTAECYLDWFSIHRIADVVAGGGGGGDTPSGDCNVHVIDLRLFGGSGDDLWVECVSALLDGKLLAIRINEGGDGDNLGFVCWSEQSMLLPSGYTKDSYIAYLRTMPLYATLTFFARQDIAGIITEGFKFTVSPTVGLRYNYLFLLLGRGIGIEITGNSDTGEFGSNNIFNFDYTDPDNPRTTSENLAAALGDVQNRGFPLFLTCRNSNNSFRISGPCYIHYVNPLMLRCHCIADYYEDPDGYTSERLPVDYHLHLTWNADPSWTQTQGYYTIYEDEVYPLALDSRFNGPVSGGEGAQ